MSSQSIRATLPTLGSVSVFLHDESAEIIDFFGKTELGRLDAVEHLGAAAAVFTGVNHTRLEYTLLQCAFIQQIADIHKNHPDLALSSPVTLDGPRSRISSGEELLKSWALLGNIGRPKWTYGVERGILQASLSDQDIRQWLLASTRITDLRQWCRRQIDDYNDQHFHYILALRRIAYGEPYDRRKTRFAHLIRNLVLPLDQLLTDNASARRKLGRLRRLYSRIRVITIITLDSYYSHNPLSLSLHSTLHNLTNLAGTSPEATDFEDTLNRIGSWLATDIYLHPRACAVQRRYELRMEEAFQPRFRGTSSDQQRAHLLQQLMKKGQGKPLVGRLIPLTRMAVSNNVAHSLRLSTHHSDIEELRNRLCNSPATELAVNRNPFSDAVYLDLFYDKVDSTHADVSTSLIRLVNWILKMVETDALRTIKNTVPPQLRDHAGIVERLKRREVQRRLANRHESFQQLFHDVVAYCLPKGWEAHVDPQLSSEDSPTPVRSKITTPSGIVYDNLSQRVSKLITDNPHDLADERVHELKGLNRLLPYRSGQLVLGCTEGIKVYDRYGERRDEWDASIVEVSDAKISLYVIEAKLTRRRQENAAFDQLAETCNLLKNQVSKYRRKRMNNLGARVGAHLFAD